MVDIYRKGVPPVAKTSVNLHKKTANPGNGTISPGIGTMNRRENTGNMHGIVLYCFTQAAIPTKETGFSPGFPVGMPNITYQF